MLCLEKLSKTHIFQTEGETWKKVENYRKHKCSHTDVFFTLTLSKHTHTHTLEDSVFRRQIAPIRDSSPCCHDNDYIYPKHRFLSYDLRCPPPRPQGECFQHNAWERSPGTTSHGADWSSLTHGESLVCTGSALWQQYTPTNKKKEKNKADKALPTLRELAVSSDDIIPVTSEPARVTCGFKMEFLSIRLFACYTKRKLWLDTNIQIFWYLFVGFQF